MFDSLERFVPDDSRPMVTEGAIRGLLDGQRVEVRFVENLATIVLLAGVEGLGIPRVYGAGVHAGAPWFAIECLSDLDLSSITDAEIVDVFHSVVNGLSVALGANLAHGEISWSTIRRRDVGFVLDGWENRGNAGPVEAIWRQDLANIASLILSKESDSLPIKPGLRVWAKQLILPCKDSRSLGSPHSALNALTTILGPPSTGLLPVQIITKREIHGLGLYPYRRQELYGRPAELARLEGILESTIKQRSVHTAVIHGPSGSGRSHLCHALTRSALEGGSIILLKAQHGPFAGAMDGLRGMLLDLFGCDSLNIEAVEESVSAGLVAWGMSEERFLQPLVLAISSGQFPAPRARYQLLRDFIAALSEIRPVVLWVDDAQWDADTLAFSQFLRQEERGKLALLLLLVVREGWPSEVIRGAAGQTVPRQGPRTIWMNIQPLLMPERMNLATESLGLEPDLAALVAGGCRGLPLVAVQVCTNWVSEGSLRAEGSQVYSKGDSLPVLRSGLRALWKSRVSLVEQESANAERCLELASALGSRFTASDWRSLCESADVELSRELEQSLMLSGLVLPVPLGWMFVHESLRDYLDEVARREGRHLNNHRLCAEMLKADNLTAALSERIGRHLLGGGRGRDALVYLLTSAELRGRGGEFELALGLIALREKIMRDLSVEDEDPRWGFGWAVRADLLRGQGFLDEASKAADKALSRAQELGWAQVVPVAMRSLALTALESDDLSSTAPLLRRARELFERSGDLNECYDCAYWQGRVSLRRGSQSAAQGQFNEAVEGFKKLGNRRGEAEAGYWLGVSLRQQGKLMEAWTVFTECEKTFREISSATGAASAILGRAIVHLFREELDESGVASKRSHTLYSSQGDDVGVADSLNAMAEVARAKGELREAELRYRQAVAILSRSRASRAVLPRLNLALVVIQRGDYIEGKELLDAVATIVEHQGKRALLGAVHALYLVVAASEGDTLMWTKHLRTSSLLLQETGAVDPDIAWATERAGELSLKNGRISQAKAAWEIAYDQWSRLGREMAAQRVLELSLNLES